MSHNVFLALGTNLGDRLANLKAAVEALPPSARLWAASPIYETTPWGYSDQPLFLNQVVQAETDLDPFELLGFLKGLEKQLGRQSTFRYGPRRIDLDILFYDDLTLKTPELVIPHPQIADRPFVLVPLADLAPDLLHPTLKKTVGELLEGVDRQGVELFSGEQFGGQGL
jgi:2-amino-4-hydroxy-6-hydroxymethyldihydropteridine diphosphokinase